MNDFICGAALCALVITEPPPLPDDLDPGIYMQCVQTDSLRKVKGAFDFAAEVAHADAFVYVQCYQQAENTAPCKWGTPPKSVTTSWANQTCRRKTKVIDTIILGQLPTRAEYVVFVKWDGEPRK